ncbi:response regulator transcription factor [Rheinheimera sp.]|uniref:response regulator transcription factor n=1 Tax=Rheinheimera sp. TaxID=1869214 RepID=UPI002734A5C8|nr:response regulator transcription factor [Rheinheimera sp.]MDP2716156.1 response regulator transcription factor [Rheinheimera sp.]
MLHILLIDDDVQLTALLAEYLQKDGFNVSSANNGAAGLECCQKQAVDLVILDVMMPQLDGISVLKQLRRDSNIPVIMLTARGEDLDKVIGLELGADDYIAKPCLPRELSARIKAILRRVQQSRNQTELQLGALCIKPVNRSVSLQQHNIELTGAEFSILYLLAQHAGHVISKAELSQQALGKPLGSYDRSIDVHISHIRQKLGKPPAGQQWVTSVRGKGYQFTYPFGGGA